jgi:hypothetical protein
VNTAINKSRDLVLWLLLVFFVGELFFSYKVFAAEPVSLFSPSATPAVASENDPNQVELGVKFTSSVAGSVIGIRYYKSANDRGTHTAHLWNSSGKLLASATFVNESSSGWQSVNFSKPIAISASKTYVASFHSNGNYAYTSNFFANAYTNGSLRAPSSAGVYRYGRVGFPNQTYQATNYYADVLFVSGSTPPPPPPLPIASLQASPSNISAGQSSSLTWSSTNATSCVGTGFSTANAVSGSASVSPSATTTYSVTCSGAGGSASANVVVNVSAAVINGQCGSANGVPTSTAPQNNLCLAGSASSVTGSGPFNWSCSGLNGGSNASCSAPLYTPGSTVELPGPSADMHAAHPHYNCVNNRYVATAANGGSDSNDGTAATNMGGGRGPWLTLSKANSSLPNPAAGYCVNIGSGTYTVSNIITLSRGGNAAAMNGFVVYRSTSLLGAKFVAASGVGGIVNVTSPYIIIDGIEIDGKRYASVDAGINACVGTAGQYNGVHHLMVFNSYVHDVGGNGICGCWAEYYWFIHNRLEGNAYNSWNSGISTYEPMVIPGYVATAYDQKFTPYHNVYLYNRSNNNFTLPENGPHTDGNGLIYDDTQHSQMSPNIVYTPKALIMGNLMTNNGGAGIQVGPGSANADVFNNTAYNNYRDTVNSGTWRGDISCSYCFNVSFKNNIGYTVRGSGILANNSPFISGNPVSQNVFSNNIAFGANPVMYSPDSYSTASNKISNPLLISVSGGNFALCTGAGVPYASCTGASPAIGFGAVVPYWQQQTPGAVDVGACPRDAKDCL